MWFVISPVSRRQKNNKTMQEFKRIRANIQISYTYNILTISKFNVSLLATFFAIHLRSFQVINTIKFFVRANRTLFLNVFSRSSFVFKLTLASCI